MDFAINGNMYLIKNTNTDMKFENDRYETTEYKMLKKWLILLKAPETTLDIQKLESKIDLLLKRKLRGLEYDNTDTTENTVLEGVFIPEKYMRYSHILDSVVEI
jgi:hypothetical protein